MRVAWHWLVEEWQWPYAGAVAALPLLVVFPILWSAEGLALALVFLQLPLYMLHQLEEHAGERYRLYVDGLLGGGREVLGRTMIFWVNALAVWALFLLVLLLAQYVDLGLGLIAIYVAGFNALTHLASAAATRGYGPGLWSAIALLLPGAAWGAYEVNRVAGPGLWVELLAVAVAVGLHAALIAIVAVRVVALRRAAEDRLANRPGPP